jgi:hypothetical protein
MRVPSRPAHPRRRTLAVQRLEDRTVPSSVQGTVFDDANRNQILDVGESGLSGWTVYVDNNRDGIQNPGEVSAVTDANGEYLIDTTSVVPNEGWNFLNLDLQVGSGGRWLNSTPATAYAHPIDEPLAVRDFGVHFGPYVSVEPDGPETLVNVTTAGPQGIHHSQWEQLQHSVAADADGNYVVTWQSPAGSNTPTVLARVFNADGTPRTGEITVANANGSFSAPQIAMADNGRFVVAWPSMTPYMSAFARVYNANGTPATSAITVAAGTKNFSNFVTSVAMDATGNFAVLYKLNKNGQNIKVQRFTAAGAPVGKAINVFTTNLANGGTRLGMDGAGRFVAAWEHAAVNSTGQIILYVYAQRYSAAGQKDGSQMLVASAPNPGIYISSLSMNRAGRFAITWRDWFGADLTARVYDWGTPVGGPIILTHPNDRMSDSDSAIDSNGNVTFVWDGSDEIHFRRLTAGGTLEPELMVNATTQGRQGVPSIAATGNDRFVVAWQGNGPGDDAGIFAQRFGPMTAPRPGLAGGESESISRFTLPADDDDAPVPPHGVAVFTPMRLAIADPGVDQFSLPPLTSKFQPLTIKIDADNKSSELDSDWFIPVKL